MIKPVSIYSRFTQTLQQNPIKNPFTLKKMNFVQEPDVFQKSKDISFTGAKEDMIRDLGHIECPCCGVKMLTDKDFKKIRTGLRQEASSPNAVKVLTPYEEYMHPVEKECFNILKGETEKNPTMNFQQIFRKNMDKHLVGLKEKENNVLDEVDKISEKLAENEKVKVKQITENTRKMIESTNNDQVKFKRKTFLAQISDLEPAIKNKEVYKEIKQTSKKMPNSSNDVNAFVVKYADRKHNEIAERLVKLSVGTIEHIHPQSKGGGNKIENYLLECGDCNHNRSSIPLDEWITEEHPEMVENTKKYVEKVEALIESGENEELEGYPEAVARTLVFESNGLIDVYGDYTIKEENAEEKENSNNKSGFGALTGAVK